MFTVNCRHFLWAYTCAFKLTEVKFNHTLYLYNVFYRKPITRASHLAEKLRLIAVNKWEVCDFFFLSATSSIVLSIKLKPLRCSVVPQNPWFSRALCGTVSQAHILFSCRHYTAAHRGVLILTLPSLTQTTIMRLHSQTSSTHVRYSYIAGTCNCIDQTLRTWGDI